MKFCPVVPEICREQVHGAWKERRIIIIIIIRNGAKTISLQTLFGRLNNFHDLMFHNIHVSEPCRLVFSLLYNIPSNFPARSYCFSGTSDLLDIAVNNPPLPQPPESSINRI